VPAPDPAIDRRFLLASIRVTAGLGVLGIVWGIATRSQMILLDGAYAMVGIVLSGLLLRASAAAGREPTEQYHYGLQALTPVAVGIQGMVLLATLAYAMYEAVLTIRVGGSDVPAGWAIAYGVVVTLGSLAFTRWIERHAGASDVLVSEASAWRLATWRGVGMVVGFGLLAVIDRSAWSELGPYVDPVMVLVSGVALLRTPIQMVRATAVELLEGAPPDHVQAPIWAAVEDVARSFALADLDVSIAKVGPKLYVEVEAAGDGAMTIREEQAARDALTAALASLPYDLWLTLEVRPHR
jgi:predicted Co/Zn/Cd cation transporter (cation efflux family)